MAYDPDQLEVLTAAASGRPGEGIKGYAPFDQAVAEADFFTLARALAFLIAEFCTEPEVIDPIEKALVVRFKRTEEQLTAIRGGDIPETYPRAYEARGPNGEKIVPSPDRSHLVNAKTGARWVSEPSEPAPFFAHAHQGKPDPAMMQKPSTPSASAPLSMSTSTETTLRDPNSLALHPCLGGMPELATDDPKFQSLVADVRDRGFDYPAIIDQQDRVIDGRHRRRIALMLGLELPTVRRDSAEASEIILSTLLQRRHYSKGALAYMAVPLFEDVVEAGRARRLANLKNDVSPSDSRKITQSAIGKTVEQLAEELGFSKELYQQASKVRDLFEDNTTEHDWSDLPRPTTYLRYFEPKILSGEIGLGGVIQAIAGKESTQGKAKVTPPAVTLFQRGLSVFTKRFDSKWEKLSPDDRLPVVKAVATETTKWPEDVQRAVLNSLKAKLKTSPDPAY